VTEKATLKTTTKAQVENTAGVDKFRLSLLAVGHAVTDSYGQSLLAPMFPQMAERLGLSLAQVGGLPMMMGLSSSLSQPVMGWLSDRRPRWCLVALGPLLAAFFIGFVGHAGSYWHLAALLFLAGIGISAYHPQGAMLARLAGRGSGLAMSAFTVGGNVGFGLAPIMGGIYLMYLGLDRLYLAALPAVLFAGVMMGAFYAGEGLHATVKKNAVKTVEGEAQPLALAALTGTVMVRAAVQIGFTTFLPFLVQQRFPVSQHAMMKSLAVSALLLSSACAGPVGGHLSDRFGRKPVMTFSFLLAPLPFILALQQPGLGLIALLALGGFILMLPHPGNVVLAQELMPRRASIAASLITGVAWGLAQILAMPLGKMAEMTSLSAALSGLCFVPLVGALLVLPIPEHGNDA